MKRSELFFTTILVPIDFLALILAGISAYYLRFHPYFTQVRPVIFDLPLQNYLSLVILVAFIWIGIFALTGLYTTRRTAIATELTRVALASSTSMAAVFAIIFFSRVFFESRFIAVAAWILAIVLVSLGRLFVRLLQRLLLRSGVGQRNIVLIGDTKTSKALTSLFETHPGFGMRVIGQFPTFSPTTKKAVLKLKESEGVDEIFMTNPELDRQTTLRLLAFTDTEHMGFRYSADLFTAASGRSVMHTYTGIPIIEVKKTPLDGWGAIYKRIFDILGSLFLILLTSPIMILAAVAIKLDSRGPIFFHRLDDDRMVSRVGEHGRPFPYFKLRSMYVKTNSLRYTKLAKRNKRKNSPLVKIENDPRVTRVGKFIRKYSIDELPELFLVLLGYMSLVGPRPHLPEEVAKYEPHHRKVLTIKPGITGLAQISGRENLDFEEEVRLDVYYIENWGPWLDIYILLKTPLIVLFGRQAS